MRGAAARPIMVEMDWWVCLGTTLIAACFIKPDPPGISDSDGNGPSDARGDSGVSGDGSSGASCAHVALHVEFVGMILPDCGGWATTTPPVMATGMGPLVMTLQPPSGSSCTSRTTGTGGFIKIAQLPPAPGDSLFLSALTQAGPVFTLRAVTGGMLEMTGTGTVLKVPYDASLHWLRLRADAGGTVIGEFSTDSTSVVPVNWIMVGTQSVGGTTTDHMTMAFGVSPGSASGGNGSVDEYNECR